MSRNSATECRLYHKNPPGKKIMASIWEIYIETFRPTEISCIQNQISYNQKTFMQAIRSGKYRKFVAMEGNRVLGFALCTDDPEKMKVARVNPVYLIDQCPEVKIWYFTVLAIRPSDQGGEAIKAILETVFMMAIEEGTMIAFDFSVEKNSRMAKMFVKVAAGVMKKQGLKHGPVYKEIGGQTYVTLDLTPKK